MKKTGFTIIELLVIISVIGLISSIALGNLAQARNKARTAAGLQFDSTVRRSHGDTLAGSWNFDEGSGDMVFDSSGNGRDGSIMGASFVTPGVNGAGSALYFDGAFSVVSGLTQEVGNNRNVTLSVWINPSQNINSQALFSSGYQACTNYAVNLTSARISVKNRDVVKFTTGNPGGTGPSTIPNNVWSNVVTSIDNTGLATTYINGQFAGTATGVPTTDCDSGIWTVGGASITADAGSAFIALGDAYTGLIDEVAVYDSALTASEVFKLYAESAPKFLAQTGK